MIDAATVNPYGPPLPSTPWANAPKNQGAIRWRKLCIPAVQHIFEVVGPSDVGSAQRDRAMTATDAYTITTALFEDYPDADPEDYERLIHWLGRASAISAKGVGISKPWLVRASLDAVVGTMTEKWAVAAWEDETGIARLPPPDWAASLIDNLLRGNPLSTNPHRKWGRPPLGDGKIPGAKGAVANAQMGLQTFLHAFEGQSLQLHAQVKSLLAYSSGNQKIVQAVMAMRILYGTTEGVVDPLPLEPLTFFQERYDHQYINRDILRRARAEVTGKFCKASNQRRKAPWH